MPKSAKRTIDHDAIRQWAEQRGGQPAHVQRTASDGDPGIIRIDFPGYSGEQSLQEISWEEWFDAFEANELAFLYQEGRDSRFNKLVHRTDEEDEVGTGQRSERGTSRRWRSKTSQVTINDASKEELDALYGIGPQNAQRIVQWRRSHGEINNRGQLLDIDGIDGATAKLIGEQVIFD